MAPGSPYFVDGEVALVTGAGGGIGAATAALFAAEGARVVVVDITGTAAEATAAAITADGGEAVGVAADVTDEAQVEAAVAVAIDRWGRLDVAHNNAGTSGQPSAFTDLSLDDWNRVVSLNLTGVFLCMKHEIPAMRRGGGGAIINTASVGGVIGTAGVTAYCATKHGVVGLTKSAALDHVKDGIRINAVCPGGTMTAMLREWFTQPGVEEAARAGTPIGRMAEPGEIARAVLFLASPEASFVVGHALVADGGLTAQ